MAGYKECGPSVCPTVTGHVQATLRGRAGLAGSGLFEASKLGVNSTTAWVLAVLGQGWASGCEGLLQCFFPL